MSARFSKNDILKTLQETLLPLPEALAACLGGSTATGFEDELSDTDLVVLSEDPERIFSAMEEVLRGFGPLLHIWRVEESMWKNFKQRFYVLDGTPDTYYLDIGIFKTTSFEEMREFYNRERHGVPVVLFDKLDIMGRAAAAPRLENPPAWDWGPFLARFEILYRTFLKESLRGKFIDSFVFYQRLVHLWVQAQRRFKTPQRHDFGLRYIQRDFTAAEAGLIEEYLRGGDLKTLQKNAADIKHRLLELSVLEGKTP